MSEQQREEKKGREEKIEFHYDLGYEIEVEGKEGGVIRIRVKADSPEMVFELFKKVREEVLND